MGGSVGSEDGDMGFQIAPMVDVVFVLLLFFMASAGSQIVEKEISINLPGTPKAGQAESTPIVIDVAPDGSVTMNNQNFGTGTDKNLVQLKEWLKASIKDFGSKDPVIIRPAADARQERVIDVLNACSFAGVTNLSFG